MLQTDTLVIELAAPDDFAGFRQAARVLLAQGVPPEAIQLAERRLIAINAAWHELSGQKAA